MRSERDPVGADTPVAIAEGSSRDDTHETDLHGSGLSLGAHGRGRGTWRRGRSRGVGGEGDVGEEAPQPQAVKITAAATVAVRMFIGPP